MEVAVYDTYVTRSDGRVMNFDILVPKGFDDTARVYEFGRKYLDNKGIAHSELTANECSLCHIEEATPEVAAQIEAEGFSILELDNCD